MNVFVAAGSVCSHGDGYFPDPDNCDQFVQCSNGQAHHTICAPSYESQPLTFNPLTNECEFVDKVACANVQYASVAPIKRVTSSHGIRPRVPPN